MRNLCVAAEDVLTESQKFFVLIVTVVIIRNSNKSSIIDEMNTIPRTKDRNVFDLGVYSNNHRRQVQRLAPVLLYSLPLVVNF